MQQLFFADHVQNVYLLDPSLAWEEGQLLTQEQEMLKGGVQVLFFTHDPSRFLQAAPGDIVRFHRIEVDFPSPSQRSKHPQPYPMADYKVSNKPSQS